MEACSFGQIFFSGCAPSTRKEEFFLSFVRSFLVIRCLLDVREKSRGQKLDRECLMHLSARVRMWEVAGKVRKMFVDCACACACAYACVRAYVRVTAMEYFTRFSILRLFQMSSPSENVFEQNSPLGCLVYCTFPT